MKYIAVYLTGADFSAFGNDSSRFSAYFADFISRPAEPLLWGAAFLLLCIYVVVRGVSEGIERVKCLPENPDIIYYKIDDPEAVRDVYLYYKKNKYLTRSMIEFIKMAIPGIEKNSEKYV